LYAFDANNLWRKNGFHKIEDLLKKNCFEVFIPTQFLNVENIQKWTSDYKSIYHITEENLFFNNKCKGKKYF
jgi:hypothetical protein